MSISHYISTRRRAAYEVRFTRLWPSGQLKYSGVRDGKPLKSGSPRDRDTARSPHTRCIIITVIFSAWYIKMCTVQIGHFKYKRIISNEKSIKIANFYIRMEWTISLSIVMLAIPYPWWVGRINPCCAIGPTSILCIVISIQGDTWRAIVSKGY